MAWNVIERFRGADGKDALNVVVESPGNDRLVAVACSVARRDLVEVAELSKRVREEIEHIFLNVTFFEPKDAEILGWAGSREAWKHVRNAMRRTSRRS